MAGPFDILLVVNADTGNELELRNMLETTMGHTVTVALDTVAGSTSGYDVVVLAHSARPDTDAASNGDYHLAPNMPVLSCNRSSALTLGFTAASPGLRTSVTTVDYIDAGLIDWVGQTAGSEDITIATASGNWRGTTDANVGGDGINIIGDPSGSIGTQCFGAFWSAGDALHGAVGTVTKNAAWIGAVNDNWNQLNTAGQAMLDAVLVALIAAEPETSTVTATSAAVTVGSMTATPGAAARGTTTVSLAITAGSVSATPLLVDRAIGSVSGTVAALPVSVVVAATSRQVTAITTGFTAGPVTVTVGTAPRTLAAASWDITPLQMAAKPRLFIQPGTVTVAVLPMSTRPTVFVDTIPVTVEVGGVTAVTGLFTAPITGTTVTVSALSVAPILTTATRPIGTCRVSLALSSARRLAPLEDVTLTVGGLSTLSKISNVGNLSRVLTTGEVTR